MTPEDFLLMLDVLFDVRVVLAPDGEHLFVTGDAPAIELVKPQLVRRKAELVAHLRRLAQVAP